MYVININIYIVETKSKEFPREKGGKCHGTDGPTRRTDRARAALTRPRDSERTDKNDHVTSGTLPRRTASTD